METAVGHRRRESIALWIDAQCLPDDDDTSKALLKACLSDYLGRPRPLVRARTVAQVLAERADRMLLDAQLWAMTDDAAANAENAVTVSLVATIAHESFRATWLSLYKQMQLAA